jgi:hypothetical protein
LREEIGSLKTYVENSLKFVMKCCRDHLKASRKKITRWEYSKPQTIRKKKSALTLPNPIALISRIVRDQR